MTMAAEGAKVAQITALTKEVAALKAVLAKLLGEEPVTDQKWEDLLKEAKALL